MSDPAADKGPMPPWHQFADVLAPDEHRALLDWTLANRARFEPARVYGGLVPTTRTAEVLRDFGTLKPVLKERLRALLPEIFRRTGIRAFEVERIELEIAAHGDGAFFSRHIDLPAGPGRELLARDGGRQDRLVSAVYYFHREPKAFSGGALRLHRFGGGEGPDDRADVQPAQNSLVVFPSWAEHEVMPIACPSHAFEDSRFAVNAWFCRRLG